MELRVTQQALVWVIGDAMLDISVNHPNYTRTPEAKTIPILPNVSSESLVRYTESVSRFPKSENLSSESLVCSLGGAANVAANIASMGCDVELFCDIASDHPGYVLGSLLSKHSVAYTHSLHTDYKTTTKTRYYESDKLIARLDSNHPCSTIIPEYVEKIPSAIVLTDYGRGALKTSISLWVNFAERLNIPLFGDPKIGRERIWDAPVNTFVCNWYEALSFCHIPENELNQSCDNHAVYLIKRLSNVVPFRDYVILKRGVYGSLILHTDDLEPTIVPPFHPTSVFDVQGAGDTYIAGLVASHCKGMNLKEAAYYGSVAAGIAVGRKGTAVVTSKDVTDNVDTSLWFNGSVTSLDEAITRSEKLRKWGFKIGYTCGCFDGYIHPGHISTINFATENCDYLFVGVDSDTRVKRLKGDSRPIIKEDDRVRGIGSLKGVYTAFVFDDHEKVIKGIRPDVMIKSEEYKTKHMVEAEYLEQIGASIKFAPLVDTMSTTQRFG